MITSTPMMEGACQSCIKDLIDSKTLADQAKIANDQSTEAAPPSQSTGDRSFAQFQQANKNLKDWHAVKKNFREDKSMERQRFVLSSTKPGGSKQIAAREYEFYGRIAMYH